VEPQHLCPESVPLLLELDDALAKRAVLRECRWCVGRVDESGRSLALTSAIGAHSLGVG
jgi:hypothetical protein